MFLTSFQVLETNLSQRFDFVNSMEFNIRSKIILALITHDLYFVILFGGQNILNLRCTNCHSAAHILLFSYHCFYSKYYKLLCSYIYSFIQITTSDSCVLILLTVFGQDTLMRICFLKPVEYQKHV
jgi:hypothetical protein